MQFRDLGRIAKAGNYELEIVTLDDRGQPTGTFVHGRGLSGQKVRIFYRNGHYSSNQDMSSDPCSGKNNCAVDAFA